MKNNIATLSVLHYVYGGLVCLLGFLLLAIMLGMRQFFSSEWFLQNAGEAPPAFLSGLMAAIGWAGFVLVELKGVANIISGRMLSQYRGRLFSQIVSAVDCLNIPFGITLGIFTLVELGKDHVKQAYQGMPAAARI